MLLLAQQNIYDKFSALRGESNEDLVFWRILTWGMLTALILAGCWFAYVWFLRRRALAADRRAAFSNRKRANLDVDPDPKLDFSRELSPLDYVTDARVDAFPALADVRSGTRIALFWDVGGLRCGTLGRAQRGESGELFAAFESDSAPTEGDATLLVPEAAGHVLFYRVSTAKADGSSQRRIAVRGMNPVSRIHHKYRAATSLRAAAIRPDAEGGALLIRVQDLAFDGFGVLSEAELTVNTQLEIRVELADYLEPIQLIGRVAWAHVDPVGLWRGGIELSHENIEQRLILADYLLSTIRAESGEIVVDERREETTPSRPVPVDPGA